MLYSAVFYLVSRCERKAAAGATPGRTVRFAADSAGPVRKKAEKKIKPKSKEKIVAVDISKQQQHCRLRCTY